MPGKKHGSGTGDRWHGGKGGGIRLPLTRLGRFSKPFVTGPNRIPFFNEESSDDDRQVVTEPEGEESDLSGVTGQAIVRAIVAGERNPQKLAEPSHPRIEAR